MRIIRTIYFLLFLVIFNSCDRISREELSSSESVEKSEKNISESEDSVKIVENSSESELGNLDTKSTLKVGNPQNETLNHSLEEENVAPQLSFLFLSFSWDTWVLVFSILILVLLLLLISLFRKNSTLNNSVGEKNKKLNKKNDEIRQLQLDVQKLQFELNRVRQKQESSVSKNKVNSQKQISKPNPREYDDEKAPEVVWSGDKTKAPEKEVKPPIHLFAEKATENSAFTSVSDQKNEHRSIFKLSLENEQAETAQFEVIDSDFIYRMVVNSPDTYLYTVCKPENSNQNFAGEIITVQKGIAHKLDGKWQVKDENKAKIKFQ